MEKGGAQEIGGISSCVVRPIVKDICLLLLLLFCYFCSEKKRGLIGLTTRVHGDKNYCSD